VGAAGPGLTASVKDAPSFLSKYWELDESDKRGTFNFTGYRPNYVLPLHYTSRINRSPQSPTHQVVPLPDYRQAEAKFQLSLRTKAVQGLLFDNADLWLGFTQQAMWQIWNAKDSKPFRNSDYEPEMSYVIAVPTGWQSLPLDWTWRYAQFALAHQSNGQSDPLSRSWNRVYLGLGFERGAWSLSTRFLQRLNEPLATDDNPDLVDYRGRGEFQLNWTGGPSTASLTVRHSLRRTANGSIQFEWTYPVVRDQPNGLRWYVQAFSGYAETLTDYNFRQKSVGAGVTFLQF
jgi:phospholipase A1